VKSRAAIALGAVAVSLLALGSSISGMRADAATDASTGSVTAAPSQFGDLRSGQPLHLFVTFDEESSAGLAAGTATVMIDRRPFSSRDSLQDWFAGTSKSSIASSGVTAVPTDEVLAGTTHTLQITVPAKALHLGASGIYAVAVAVTANGTAVTTARTAVAWKTTGSQSVPVALAAPLTVPAGSGDFISAANLATYTAPTGVLTRELADLENTQVAIGIDPRILASIRILGKTAPQSARDWLVQLEGVSNQTFPLAWADSDLTVGLQAGATSVLTPEALDYAIVPDRFSAPTSTQTPSPTETPDPDNPPLPTSQSLTAFGYTLPDLSWPAENSVTAADVAKLQDSQISGAILASTNVKQPSGSTSASATVGGLSVDVSDATISGYLRDAAAAPTRESWSAAMTRLTTSIALLGLESDSTPPAILATFGRNWQDTDTNFDETLTGMFTRPWVSPMQLGDVADASSRSITIRSTPQSADRITRVTEMLAAEARVIRFSVITDPNRQELTSSRRLVLLSLLSDEWIDNPTGWNTATNGYLKDSRKITQSVQVAKSSNVLLLGNQAPLPITVSNNLDQPVTVYVAVRPRTTLIAVDKNHRLQAVTVNAQSQRRIEIPIQSLSNGKVEVAVSLYSQTGRQVGATTAININVQAGWETVGTLLFGALVVGIFAFGLVRNIRKRRKAGPVDDTEPASE
jgi:hypothetical protein